MEEKLVEIAAYDGELKSLQTQAFTILLPLFLIPATRAIYGWLIGTAWGK